jgi:oligopeptide/dipeptide ABC transporter ATP-binding protein
LKNSEISPVLLELRNLKKHYTVGRGLVSRDARIVKAVDGVDISLQRGETLGLVGESGCGKSTLGRLILRLEESTEGEVVFDGRSLTAMSSRELRPYRRRMQIIFQDPYSSLNPRQTIGRIIGEGLLIHGVGNRQERRRRVEYLMEVVGLRPEHFNRYPHEFSGGQRQRVGIARALALQPELVICDEPLSALDVSIQAQVINLLRDLQDQYNLTYLFISHDLSVVRHISDWVAVMYFGRIVELARKKELFDNPCHPYTRRLLQAIPVPDPAEAARKKQLTTPREDRDEADPPTGCGFVPLCSGSACDEGEPELTQYSTDHWVRCWKGSHIKGP